MRRGWDLVAAGLGGFQNGQAFGNLIGNAFNFNVNHISFPPYFFTMAFSLQLAMQAPHLTHFTGSICQEGSFLPGAV